MNNKLDVLKEAYDECGRLRKVYVGEMAELIRDWDCKMPCCQKTKKLKDVTLVESSVELEDEDGDFYSAFGYEKSCFYCRDCNAITEMTDEEMNAYCNFDYPVSIYEIFMSNGHYGFCYRKEIDKVTTLHLKVSESEDEVTHNVKYVSVEDRGNLKWQIKREV